METLKLKMGKYMAPPEFYKKVGAIAVPLALQSVLSSCMGIVDSLMVSWIGMVSAVGTAAQFDTLATIASYGAVNGTGIFCSQFFGAKDYKNLKKSFGMSVILSIAIALLFFTMSTFFGRYIMKFYLNDPDVIHYGTQYLMISRFAFAPSILTYAFNYVYRTIHNTKVPLFISSIGMVENIVLNYLLIFGKFGFPEMGVEGAALATLIANCTMLAIHLFLAIKTHKVFWGTFTEMFVIKLSLVKMIMKKIAPLIVNEFMFGFGNTLYIKAFGTLGTASMDAYYVANRLGQFFLFAVMGVATATSVITGSTLGSGDIERAKKEGNYFIGMASVLAVITTVAITTFAGPMVAIFGLKDPAVVADAIGVVRVIAIKIALRLFIVIILSSLRAGGDSKIISYLDSGIMWVVGLPLAFLVVNVFNVRNIATVYLFIQLEQVVRVSLGMVRYKSYKWAVNLTKEAEARA